MNGVFSYTAILTLLMKILGKKGACLREFRYMYALSRIQREERITRKENYDANN